MSILPNYLNYLAYHDLYDMIYHVYEFLTVHLVPYKSAKEIVNLAIKCILAIKDTDVTWILYTRTYIDIDSLYTYMDIDYLYIYFCFK